VPGLRATTITDAAVARLREVVETGCEALEPYVARLCHAIGQAHAQWRLLAHFREVAIEGEMASGGRLDGPNLEPFIRAYAPQTGVGEDTERLNAAVARGLGALWADFQRSLSIPGLKWYPTFADVAGPAAAPVPNRPAPLAACAGDWALVSAPVIGTYLARVPLTPVPHAAELLDAVATGFAAAVDEWLLSQMIMNVVGHGPVPTFAPPHAPHGPVEGGTIIPAPGHLAS
jgi:hypothetical protein